MAILLGIDTGGTYTDAVLLDDVTDQIIAKAKSLTTRPDLSRGIGAAMDAVLAQSGVAAKDVALVSLSTTLATNALVEGHGGLVALIVIGFDQAEFAKFDLFDALGADPVLFISGGHTHSGNEVAQLDEKALCARLETLPTGLTGIAIAARFATRNPAHEKRASHIVRGQFGLPVTCSHELSQSLGGPKRALTALLNARLIGLIDRLISATERHMAERKIGGRLMVVRGDGALISAELARERPIETILSGPAASIAGAQWLTGAQHALVSDIGGTTTDICMLKNGVPQIDSKGAKVGDYRTMVEAVAMHTFGLGGDSEVAVVGGFDGGLTLGPKRLMPVSLLAQKYPELVHAALDRAMGLDVPQIEVTRFILPQWHDKPTGLDPRETAVMDRLQCGPVYWTDAVQNRADVAALTRLVKRGLTMICGVTPSDASHVLGRATTWDRDAATKALTLFARQRIGSGERLAINADTLAQLILDQLENQTSWALLETAFSEDGWTDPRGMARHTLIQAGLRDHKRTVRISAGLAIPVVGLGASAQTYYGAVGDNLGCQMILPADGDVANAIGAVVGQVAIHAEGSVTSAGEGVVRAHLPDGVVQFCDKQIAIDTLRTALVKQATDGAHASGVGDVRISETLDLREVNVEAQLMFIEATLRVTARGRPRIAR